MSKIVVTGGSGYIGGNLCAYLANQGHEVVPVMRELKSNAGKWLSSMSHFIVGDMRDQATIDTVRAVGCDTIIHLVSLDHHQSEGPAEEVAPVNVVPTWALLDVMAQSDINRFIYLSTIHVYGRLAPGDVTEEQATNPGNTYGLTHLMCEELVELFRKKTGKTCINARLSNSYGAPAFKENNCWWLVINDLCKQAIESQKMVLLSDGSPQRDFIHMYDVCSAVSTLATVSADTLAHTNYHVCSGVTSTILELAHAIQGVYRSRYNSDIPIQLPDGSISKMEQIQKETQRYSMDTSRMEHLGYKPSRNLEQGIETLFEYLENKQST